MIYEDRTTSSLEQKAKKTQGNTFLPSNISASILRTIDYEYPQNKITVKLNYDEFTCLCPFSGLPDFAHLIITYVPNKFLIELKALKYYLYAFRSVKIYNEHAVNKIAQDINKVLEPCKITVEGEFTIRGGIKNKIVITLPPLEIRPQRSDL